MEQFDSFDEFDVINPLANVKGITKEKKELIPVKVEEPKKTTTRGRRAKVKEVEITEEVKPVEE